MEINYSGLKCDHCDYRDDSVQFSEYQSSIGKPCPECGNSLLTQKDYDSCLRVVRVVDTLNRIGNVLKWINPFYYWRLIFGDCRKKYSMGMKFYRNSPTETTIEEI